MNTTFALISLDGKRRNLWKLCFAFLRKISLFFLRCQHFQILGQGHVQLSQCRHCIANAKIDKSVFSFFFGEIFKISPRAKSSSISVSVSVIISRRSCKQQIKKHTFIIVYIASNDSIEEVVLHDFDQLFQGQILKY